MLFFHDLQSRSGIGDRLLDLWAAITIARLHDPHSEVLIKWNNSGYIFAGFIGDYSTDLFSIEGCRFVDESPAGAVCVTPDFRDEQYKFDSFVKLTDNTHQIILRNGSIWGQSSPDQLQTELAHYELDPEIPLQRIIETYRNVAQSTVPGRQICERIPENMGKKIGVHVRLQDKIVETEIPWEMTRETWRSIEMKSVLYLDRCIARGESLYICSDDPRYKQAFIEDLRNRQADVMELERKNADQELIGLDDLVEFFTLSKCKYIMQMTKYSAYSMAAAMVGDIPLLNVYRGEGGEAGHLLDMWKDSLTLMQ